jgi:cyclomaltodextrinase / maltogenic alpha-amylase / neopullulanase
MSLPGWVDSTIWWQVYPLGFAGAEKEARLNTSLQHRLPEATWLDYLVELGCNGLALGPIFASETHGYDTIDLMRIDPRLGDETDFDRLVSDCQERGIRVLLDGVFNHVGRGHPRFRQALEQGPGSPAADWFHFRESDGDLVAENFEGHAQLVVLNHSHQPVIDYVTEAMNHWLDRGIDGWRLDAAYAVPTAFWASVLPGVRQRHPEAWFVGEVIHGDYASYVEESGLDSITQYELWKAIWSSLNDGNLFELDHALTRHNQLLETFVPMTFAGNHDVSRLASILDDPRHIAHALAVLFFVGGIPSIYYGDEQAFIGVKEARFGGDDAIRPAFPATPAELPAAGWSTFHLHQRMISIRRRYRWLARTKSETVQLANEQLALRATAPDAGSELILLLNLADVEARPALDLGKHDVVEQSDGSAADRALIGPHGWALLGADLGSS